MHIYELKIIEFMKQVGANPLEMEEKLLQPASKDVAHYLQKMYEEEPNREFTIRMSNVGKPLCQLQMEKAGTKKVDYDWNFPLRLMYGGIVEGLAVSIMRHAGINIEEEQTKVSLPVEYSSFSGPFGTTREKMEVNGTLDLVIDGKVWDIKSASPYAYKEKFESYDSLKEHDDFGYLPQLYGYSKARGLPAGGWIVIDKSSGEMKSIEVSDNWEQDQVLALELIQRNVQALMNTEEVPFKRCFSDKEEMLRKKPTGNRTLGIQCTYCPFKYSCWPDLQHLPSKVSSAFDKPFKYYSKVAQ